MASCSVAACVYVAPKCRVAASYKKSAFMVDPRSWSLVTSMTCGGGKGENSKKKLFHHVWVPTHNPIVRTIWSNAALRVEHGETTLAILW